MRLVDLVVDTDVSRSRIRVQAEHLHVVSGDGFDCHRVSVYGLEFEVVVMRPVPRPFRPRMMQSTEFPTGKLEEEPRPVIRLPAPDAFQLYLSGSCAREFLYAHHHFRCERCGQPRRRDSSLCEECLEGPAEAQTERQLAEFDEHCSD